MTATTHYKAPSGFDAAFNRAVRWLADRGVNLAGAQTLTVVGRKTGMPQRVPVNVLRLDGAESWSPSEATRNGSATHAWPGRWNSAVADVGPSSPSPKSTPRFARRSSGSTCAAGGGRSGGSCPRASSSRRPTRISPPTPG